MSNSTSPYIGKTVKSRQDYWYEVYEAADNAEEEIHLVPVDTVPGQHVSAKELDERMANGWEVVYDGTTRGSGTRDRRVTDYEHPFYTLNVGGNDV